MAQAPEPHLLVPGQSPRHSLLPGEGLHILIPFAQHETRETPLPYKQGPSGHTVQRWMGISDNSREAIQAYHRGNLSVAWTRDSAESLCLVRFYMCSTEALGDQATPGLSRHPPGSGLQSSTLTSRA